MLLCMLEAVEFSKFVGGAETDALYTTLYVRGCGELTLFARGVGGAAEKQIVREPEEVHLHG